PWRCMPRNPRLHRRRCLPPNYPPPPLSLHALGCLPRGEVASCQHPILTKSVRHRTLFRAVDRRTRAPHGRVGRGRQSMLAAAETRACGAAATSASRTRPAATAAKLAVPRARDPGLGPEEFIPAFRAGTILTLAQRAVVARCHARQNGQR